MRQQRIENSGSRGFAQMSQPWFISLMSQHRGDTPAKPLLAYLLLHFIQGPSLVCPMRIGETVMNPNKNWKVFLEIHSHVCSSDSGPMYFTMLETYPSSNGQTTVFNSDFISPLIIM